MTHYIVKLSEQEELSLRQLTVQPGFDALLKLLQGESLSAQSEAMQCDGAKETRLLKLGDAQATVKVVSSLTKKLCSYRDAVMPAPESMPDELQEMLQTTWERKPS